MKKKILIPKDTTMGYCELSNDLLFHKIPKEKIDYYITSSIKIGEELAEKYAGKDIFQLIKENSIELEYLHTKNVIGGVSLRGEFTFSKKGKNTISVYKESIDSIITNCNPILNDELKLDVETFEKVHLAHEFFHYIEYAKDGLVSTRLGSIESFKILAFSRKAYINKCSEIAAHAFSKKINQIKVFPNFYDYVYLISNKEYTWQQFEALTNEYDN